MMVKSGTRAGIFRLGTGALGIAVAILLAGAALAADPPSVATMRADTGTWQIDAASYGWFSSFSGTTATLPPLPAADVDLSFGDILSHLDGALMGVVYARRDRVVLYGDLMYSKLSVRNDINTSFLTSLKLATSTLIASGGAGYSLVDNSTSSLDLLAGARLYNVDTNATLNTVRGSLSGGTNETWADPMVGARFSTRLSERWYLTSWAFAGGFTVGSKFSWDLFGGVGYDIDDRFTATLGYRGLGVDYARGDYVYDVVQQGPIAGLKIRF